MASTIILHIDMDAFFASVEQMDDPALRGKPVVVGGRSQRGVVAAASYEARRYGIHSAMPIYQARQRCRELVIVPPHRKRYSALSRKIMAILETFSPLVEPISIDEAFVDITGCRRLHGSPTRIAAAMKERILQEVGLTCSVGVAPVKFLAKIASDMDKPDGLTVIDAHQMSAFIDRLAIGKVPGVGKRAEKAMSAMGIQYLGQVRSFPEALLIKKLGKFGLRLIALSRGEDDSPVTPTSKAKSISTETTLSENTMDRRLLDGYLRSQSQSVARDLRRKHVRTRTITIKIKTDDFKLHSRSRTLTRPVQSAERIYQVASELFHRFALSRPVRLIGVGTGALQAESMPIQADIFPDGEQVRDRKWEKVDRAMDAVSERFGDRAVVRGTMGPSGKKDP
ncbi:MAG: DNA polymerase IV [Desulfobacteraceae bacterium]